MTGVWLIIRLAGIALGIITLLGFASGYLGVEFKPYFKNVLDWLERHLVDFIVRPEEIEWTLDYLRQHFTWVPKPEPHWKTLYTLTTLLILSLARRARREVWYAVPIAIVCSLVPAVFAGTMPVGSWAVAVWPISGFIAFMLIPALQAGYWWSALSLAAFTAALAALGYFIDTTGEGSGALVGLAVVVGSWGILMLLLGLIGYEGSLSGRLKKPGTAIGLDITATLGGALALGYLFAA
jgi:hypothetical protein